VDFSKLAQVVVADFWAVEDDFEVSAKIFHSVQCKNKDSVKRKLKVCHYVESSAPIALP
jgi:hypothetical protein